MKKSDRNWIAGIMDKGCGITGFTQRNIIYVRIIISSTNAEIAMRLHRLVKAGSIQIVRREWTIKAHGLSPRKSKIVDNYRYLLTGQAAADFLLEMLPYLRTERSLQRACAALQLNQDGTRRSLRKLRALGTRTIKQ